MNMNKPSDEILKQGRNRSWLLVNQEKKINFELIQKQIRTVAYDFIKKAKTKYISNLSNDEIQALKELKNDRSIVILRADKGNAIVIMDKKDYMNKVKEILNDQRKFISIKEDESTIDETIINRRLASLKKDKKISVKEYEHLFYLGKLDSSVILYS